MAARTALERLRQLVEVETPSFDPAASAAVTDLLAGWFADVGATVEFVRSIAGTHLRLEVAGDGRAPLLLVGHCDTVWPVGTLADRMPWSVEGDVVRGPGVYDMKGGLIVMLTALEALRARAHRPVRIVIVCDEEAGSPTSQDLVRDCLDGVAGVIGFESPHEDGALKVGRRGSTRVRLVVRGRAAHAAVDPTAGVSAIDELVDQLVGIRRLVATASARSEVLCNVGTISGGGRANVVPEAAECELGLRFLDTATEHDVLAALGALRPIRAGARLEVDVLSHRPPWAPGSADRALAASIGAIAAALGLPTPGYRKAAGAGDTNLTGALGVPTVDGFGPRGGGAHALDEHILFSSLVQRSALLVALLTR
ncbi:M20/M25/M40 family metallo-hydrolase [Raineyella fluvialis]|uniref:M20/M25/M40 family metallo-hydrolase n=1 Tax=Raineyella fluvialis TaxID=2662261 RepID=A0A5Q2F7F0_9ACTN|nr:M20/M25/M40 family metallo-hydrolase [Raineyella fluvialis]QGF22920.1 M20/M25/M40 family metallo-hydrolase [Raineyella fluvialis]